MNRFSFFQKRYKTARRLQHIVNVFLKYGFGRAVDQVRLSRYIPFLTRLRSFGQWPSLKAPGMPQNLRRAFEELGPTFIKFAQVLAARPDIVGAEYADEFKKLLDEVPPFPAPEAIEVIERELGLPMEKVFRSFDERPVAAASIAQVHTATLMDGSEVVVKVQRPGISDIIGEDIQILTAIARLVERYAAEVRFFNPVGLIEEFARTVKKEMNFVQEAKNCCRFRRDFEGNPDIRFPQIYPEFLTEKVLVMERIYGVRIDDIKRIDEGGFDRLKLARAGVDAYFKMVFTDGFFHADPHPGNIFVTPEGQLAFLDFGIVGAVTDELKDALASTLIALINKDYDRLIENYITLGYVRPDIDLETFRMDFKSELVELLEPMYGLTLGEINLAEYLSTFLTLAMRHNMRIPPELMLINKSLLILENIGLELDPAFDFFAAAEPYASKLIKKKYSPGKLFGRMRAEAAEAGELAFYLPRNLKRILGKLLRNDIQVKLHHLGLENLIKDMDRSSNRLAFAMVVSAMIISGSIMHAMQVPPRIFGISVLGFLSFFFAGIFGLWLVISIIRSGRL
ncbi:MAG: AarF/ABC1/UbiB kinase family protein [Nitrospiraceae bacterium]|nr:AarF/ABC1/UbiB kinase family protein [Nitrospiraceae bacterium]MDA8324888.1 AarF/ABC1/UbiB kinase family protein [Nitrospiraceae bacterium]